MSRATDARAQHRRMPLLIKLATGILALAVIVAVAAPLLAPWHYTEQSLLVRLAPPVWAGGTWAHPLGTDEIGRDVLSRLIYGTRVSLLIALAGTLIGAVLGTLLGFLAAHFRGLVDDAVMVMVDFQAAVPFIIVVLTVLAVFGNDLWLFLVLVGIAGWEVYARLTRAMTFAAQEQGYVRSIRAAGAGPARIYLRHVLPNILSVIVVQITLNFPATILLETGLSFLGLGVQPPLTSLGLMLGEGRDYLIIAWWMAVFPGIAIFLITLSMTLVGDWLRDRLDPMIDD